MKQVKLTSSESYTLEKRSNGWFVEWHGIYAGLTRNIQIAKVTKNEIKVLNSDLARKFAKPLLENNKFAVAKKKIEEFQKNYL